MAGRDLSQPSMPPRNSPSEDLFPAWIQENTTEFSFFPSLDAEFAKRRRIVYYTILKNRTVLDAVDPAERPRVPTEEDARALPKRSWEKLLRSWRISLRELASQLVVASARPAGTL